MLETGPCYFLAAVNLKFLINYVASDQFIDLSTWEYIVQHFTGVGIKTTPGLTTRISGLYTLH